MAWQLVANAAWFAVLSATSSPNTCSKVSPQPTHSTEVTRVKAAPPYPRPFHFKSCTFFIIFLFNHLPSKRHSLPLPLIGNYKRNAKLYPNFAPNHAYTRTAPTFPCPHRQVNRLPRPPKHLHFQLPFRRPNPPPNRPLPPYIAIRYSSSRHRTAIPTL